MLLLVIVSFLCSHIVGARYCSREIDHSSPTGEFVSFSINNEESRIRVRANGLNFFGWIGGYAAVRGFKGDGNGYPRSWPTIVSSAVYKSLFSPEALPAVFDGMDKEKMELALSAQRESVSNEKKMHPFFKIKKFVLYYLNMLPTMRLVVNDADRPISIGNREHVYFWGAARLPTRAAGECANYTTSNDNRNVSFCKHEEMKQCAAKISAFPQLTPFTLETLQGEPLTKFTWLCKAGSVCCAWECCEPIGWEKDDTFAVFLLIYMPGSMLVLYILKLRFRRRIADEEEKAKTEAEVPLQDPDHLHTITPAENSPILGTTNEKLDHGAIIDTRAFIRDE